MFFHPVVPVQVTTLREAFYGCESPCELPKYVGLGMRNWDVSRVTTLQHTFRFAQAMNAELDTWDVSAVTTLYHTFSKAVVFTGRGLANWDTKSVTSMRKTFMGAIVFNADMSRWRTAKVTELGSTFSGAARFTGQGLEAWSVGAVTDIAAAFDGAMSLTSCTKRKIADAWTAASDPGGSAFTATSYDTDWAADVCFVSRWSVPVTMILIPYIFCCRAHHSGYIAISCACHTLTGTTPRHPIVLK